MNSLLSATDFTICSYNCGSLSAHYDYLRAVATQKILQDRYTQEPEQMAQVMEIQKTALRILFASDGAEKQNAKYEWTHNQYSYLVQSFLIQPQLKGSPHAKWQEKIATAMTPYKARPVILFDAETNQIIEEHLLDLSHGKAGIRAELLDKAYSSMAKRNFEHFLKFDIICLQEADYIDPSFLPAQYELQLIDSDHSKNGIAWNKERFELKGMKEGIKRCLVLELIDKETGCSVLVASAHLTGCDPFYPLYDAHGISDSKKGDIELWDLLHFLKDSKSDFIVIGMDSNVTSLHPRLKFLKDAAFKMDAQNFIEPSCTNPYYLLDTRIDWIAYKEKGRVGSKITNIPVLGIGLNNVYNNMSDHRPVAAKITY
jgi:hypothetical protein